MLQESRPGAFIAFIFAVRGYLCSQAQLIAIQREIRKPCMRKMIQCVWAWVMRESWEHWCVCMCVCVCVCVTGSPLKVHPPFLSKVCPPNNSYVKGIVYLAVISYLDKLVQPTYAVVKQTKPPDTPKQHLNLDLRVPTLTVLQLLRLIYSDICVQKVKAWSLRQCLITLDSYHDIDAWWQLTCHQTKSTYDILVMPTAIKWRETMSLEKFQNHPM